MKANGYNYPLSDSLVSDSQMLWRRLGMLDMLDMLDMLANFDR